MIKKFGNIICGIIILSVPHLSHASNEMKSNVTIIDGDSLEMQGKRIHLNNIDAPELLQTCYIGEQSWKCGRFSAKALADYVGKRTVTCIPLGRDYLGTLVAECFYNGFSLNAWMVLNGWALDNEKTKQQEYKEEEDMAKKNRSGLWSSRFDKPWNWRALYGY